MTLIGLHGAAGAGKDTFADRLVERHGFVKRGFAAPLYEEVAEAYGVAVDWLKDRGRKEAPQDELALRCCRDEGFRILMALKLHVDKYLPRSPRWILERWGTDYRRAQSETYWLERMADFAAKHERVVIPDVRFQNEAHWIFRHLGSVIRIVRPGLPKVSSHVSAMPLPDDMISRTVQNVGSVSYLHAVADSVIRGAQRTGEAA